MNRTGLVYPNEPNMPACPVVAPGGANRIQHLYRLHGFLVAVRMFHDNVNQLIDGHISGKGESRRFETSVNDLFHGDMLPWCDRGVNIEVAAVL